MKQYQFLFENGKTALAHINQLKTDIASFEHGDTTFYITWMNDAKEDADYIAATLQDLFPESIVYGNEALGNIYNGSHKLGVNVTCYVFEDKSTKTELVWVEQGTEISSLEDLWAYCKTREDLCAVELIASINYLDLMHIDGNLPDLDEKIDVFGGVACNYFCPDQFSGILANGHPRTTVGIAAILYSGKKISFNTATVLGWKSLGKKMKVTAATENVITEINHMPAFEIYEHYLGLSVHDDDSLVFPLMVTEGLNDFIRTPMIFNGDKSMTMFAKIPVGAECSIAYGDKNTILATIAEQANMISRLQPEVIKAFSCGGRKLFWGDDEISSETEIFQKIAPVSGYYTGGEIVRIDNTVRVLNQTLAITSISENNGNSMDNPVFMKGIDKSLVARLAHFTETVAAEHEEEERRLKQNIEIIGGLASQYTTLYLVNLDNDTFVNYSCSAQIPGTNSSFSESTSFGQLCKNFASSGFVHPDSMQDFEAFFGSQKELIRKNKTASLVFKRKYGDEYLWTRVLVVKCEAADEEPHQAVVGFMECDSEVRHDETLHTFTNVLERGRDPKTSIDNILYSLADFYQADRAYVLERYNNGRNIRCTYSWNKDGIPKIEAVHSKVGEENLEKLICSLGDSDCVLHTTNDTRHEAEKAILDENRISASLSSPLKQNGNVVGFVAVDNPRKSVQDASIGKIATAVINSEIMRRKENDEEHITLGKLSDSFVSVYYANLDSDYIRAWKHSELAGEITSETSHCFSDLVASYIQKYAADSEKERLRAICSPENIINQFMVMDCFSFDTAVTMAGKEKTLAFDFIRVTDDGKQFVISCRDVTEITLKQKEHQKQLQVALDMAKSANRAKTEFLFNLSHDIRTPMNAILGYTDMAIRHFNAGDRAMESLSKIKSSGEHLLNLINDILEMSRIESGKFELVETPLDIREAIKNVVNMTQSLAVPHSIDYKVDIEELKNPYIYADELHINEVIVNIISNAIKYSREGGKVRYLVRQISDVENGKVWYRFSINDNGIGMSEEFQKHLFESFSREKSSTVSKIQGAGLGLSIVKRIVDLAGGRISVNSKINEGSSFVVDLPFRVMDEKGIEILLAERLAKNNATINEDVVLSGKRVLLVEDNEMNREIATEILADAGLDVDTAENGQIAVDMVSDKGVGYYDLVLMDIQMPILDGYGATTAIRNLPDGDKIAIIALSANAFDEDKQKSISMGMNAHVAKPIDVNELFAVMREHAKA